MSFPRQLVIAGRLFEFSRSIPADVLALTGDAGAYESQMVEQTRKEAEAFRDRQLEAQGLRPPPAIPVSLALSSDAADPSSVDGAKKLAERWRAEELIRRGFQP